MPRSGSVKTNISGTSPKTSGNSRPPNRRWVLRYIKYRANASTKATLANSDG